MKDALVSSAREVYGCDKVVRKNVSRELWNDAKGMR